MKVFLGGTCNGSTWRDELIPRLEDIGVEYFNPVVEDWTESDRLEEERMKEECDIILYVITKEMLGVYTIAEIIDSSHRHDHVFLYIEDYNEDRFGNSLYSVRNMAYDNGVNVVSSMEEFLETIDIIVNGDIYELSIYGGLEWEVTIDIEDTLLYLGDGRLRTKLPYKELEKIITQNAWECDTYIERLERVSKE